MENQALYRKYRPKTFEDVCGQDVIVQTLKNIIKNNKLTHAYLFIGPRGTGKTSVAKIFSKSINCLNSDNGISCEKCEICKITNSNENIDIIEMDAASNNGVDEIREIKNHITLMPTISKYKIYIIDEVHMLTTGAFNALLKTLEEPPQHVIFILATTEPHKIPLTIKSRCQSFEFKPISKTIIKERMKQICTNENIKIDENALDLIALDSNGGMRDAISLLDQLNAYSNSNIKYEDVLLLNGRISTKEINQMLINIYNGNFEDAFEFINELDQKGKNFVYISEDMIKILRDELFLYKTGNKQKCSLIKIIESNNILDIILIINKFINDMKNSKDKKIFFDIMILEIYELINKTNVRNNKKVDEVAVSNDYIDKKENNNFININEQESVDNNQKNLYKKLMDIRLNNILASADKDLLLSYKEKYKAIEDEITDLEKLKVVNMLIECELRAASETGVVITTKSDKIIIDMFNQINLIEELLSKIMDNNLKVCILFNDDWVKKREVYVKKIKNKEKIEYIEEKDILQQINKLYNNSCSTEFDDLLEIGGE